MAGLKPLALVACIAWLAASFACGQQKQTIPPGQLPPFPIAPPPPPPPPPMFTPGTWEGETVLAKGVKVKMTSFDQNKKIIGEKSVARLAPCIEFFVNSEKDGWLATSYSDGLDTWWIKKSDAVRLVDAKEHCDARIKKNAMDSDAFALRAAALMFHTPIDETITFCRRFLAGLKLIRLRRKIATSQPA